MNERDIDELIGKNVWFQRADVVAIVTAALATAPEAEQQGLTDAAHAIPCPHCWARVGEPCIWPDARTRPWHMCDLLRQCLPYLKAALASRPAVQQEGWVMVPVESTVEMDSEGHDMLLNCGLNAYENDAARCWSAMIAAAPPAAASAKEG